MKYNYSHHISLIPLCKEHIFALVSQLRKEDLAEMHSAYGMPAMEVLQKCWERSIYSVALVCGERVLAVGGVEPDSLLGGRGCVWAWTGKEVEKHKKSFWKASLRVIKKLRQSYPLLYAVCDERYPASLRYVCRLGGKAVGEKFRLYDKKTYFQVYQFDDSVKGKNE